MIDIPTLIWRLERLTEASREADAWIGYHANLTCDDLSWREKIDNHGIEHAVKAARSHQNIWSSMLPPYTESLDAALGFARVQLPTWRIQLRFGDWPLSDPRHVTLWSDDHTRKESIFGVSADHALPAVALVTATLKAMETRS